MLLLLVVLAGIAGTLGYFYKLSKNAIDTITTDANPATVIPKAKSVAVKPVSIMLLGLDTRKETGSLNTDVMMIAAFNPKTKKATVISIPRDSKIELSGYNSRKANAYYANFLREAEDKTSDKAEADRTAKQGLRKMFGEFFGIPIDYTATINFQGFADVVDALHGVDVNVDMDMNYNDHAGQPDGTSIHLKKGFQHLDGEEALGFVRYRKSNDGKNMSSDFDRNRRQSEVLGEIADKLKSLSGVTKIPGVIKAVGNNMKMDIPSGEVQKMITTYFGISRSDITFIPLEGTWRSPYVYLDADKLEQAKAALRQQLAD
ncbi:LCP family protein [Paenibacillus humicola]|uniref:LCP family protein n=1 Tax=Paenibacillus humicola TaxID=3110540 RepID=UPI00237B5F10|nr:LCP family protein [Paenibacillus humicola]